MKSEILHARKRGRPRVQFDLEQIKNLWRNKQSLRRIEKMTGISKSKIWLILKGA
jgi:hypothetical protein